MKSRLYQIGIAGIWVGALFVFVNCGVNGEPLVEGTLNGGGKIVRSDGTTATFTYHASNCGAPDVDPSGHFNFLDKSASAFASKNGVMADGVVTGADICSEDNPTFDAQANGGAGGCISGQLPGMACPVGGYMFQFSYRNKNKFANNGTDGLGAGCVVDNGQGRNAPGPDLAGIGFSTGGYAGYQTTGTISGNAQIGLCD